MNEQRPPLFVPAVIGGTIAAALWAKDSQSSLKAGDGALVGAYTGVFAAIAHTLVGIPMAAVNSRFFMRMFERLSEYTNEMPDNWRQWFDQGAISVSIPGFLLNLVISAAVFCLLGVLGGVLGAALFGKKTPPSGIIHPPVPPSPQGPAA